ISESSPDAGLPLATRELVGAELPRDLVEYRVDHAGLFGFDKGVRDIDIFGDDDAARHVLAVLQFIGARPQHRAQNRVDPLQRPALRQSVIDQGIEFGLVAHHAGHDVAEERGFGRQILVALDLVAEPVAFELGEDVVDAGAADVHLVQRLHGGEPRRAAAVGFLVGVLGRLLVVCHRQAFASRRLIRSIASAARAASPPLLSSLARARAQACASVLTVMMPLPSGNFRATARSIRAREDSIETISKWMVSPRTTQPSAIAASYGLPFFSPASIAIAIAAGISSAPGTVMTSCATPAAFNSATAPSISASWMSS